MKHFIKLWKDTRGYAVVEATILFPIIFMTFAALTLLSMYLPTRMVLQHATQYAATALATEQSDTWLEFDEDSMEYTWGLSRYELNNVYIDLIASFLKGSAEEDANDIVTHFDKKSLVARRGKLEVDCEIVNYIIYKELVITATRNIPMPVNLSLINFPKEIPVVVSSTAVVQNGDEFVRNMDIAAEYLSYLNDKYDLKFEEISNWINKAWEFLGV